MSNVGFLVIFITIITNYVSVVHGDCEMDCTDSQVQQFYRSVSNNAGNSRVNFGIYFVRIFNVTQPNC